MNIQRYFSTVDAHIGGEPLRVILGGFPPILGHTMEERLRYFERHLDSIRKVLLQEPRGHGGMQACLITAPEKPSSHFGLLTMNAYGYAFRGLSAMAAAAVSLETGLIPLRGETVEVAIDTPRETVTVTAVAEGTEVRKLLYREGPAYVLDKWRSREGSDREVEAVIAVCGERYAIVDSRALPLEIGIGALPEWRKKARRMLEETKPISAVVFADFSSVQDGTVRCLAFDRNGRLFRMPDTTMIGACLAALEHSGWAIQEKMVRIQGISGGIVSAGWEIGPAPVAAHAIWPIVSGRAFITGSHQFVLDPDDRIGEGFILL